jgi:hypothetical protein
MLSASLLVEALAAFSAGILNEETGFGFAVTVVPLHVLVYDPKTVVVALCYHPSWADPPSYWALEPVEHLQTL